MDLQLNKNEPTIMHIDLNSCFATVEQQANPLLRGKSIAVAPYTGPGGCVIAPSIEAKARGVKVGMRVRDAKMICPELLLLNPDPPKYRAVHLLFRNIFREYSPNVTPKSIDEAVIDFSGTPALKKGLENIGYEIKERIKNEIGEWMKCNVGISTNRFLAKTAASLHKPDGLDTITHENLRDVYAQMELTDLCGINTRYEARLNAAGIFSPLEFLDAPAMFLKKRVFQSIVGFYWYTRLRGYEIDKVEFARKSYGQSYALHKFTSDKKELSRMLIKLVEKMGKRMRSAGYCAKGIHISCLYTDGTHWGHGMRVPRQMYTSFDLYKRALFVLNRQPEAKKVTHLAVTCFELSPAQVMQQELFDTISIEKRKSVTRAMDKINDRFGEFMVCPALMMRMNDEIVDRISFGGVKELEELYSTPQG